jgi:hypothetical protein
MPAVYFSFALSTHSSVPVAFNQGSRLSIWFPFVLDDRKGYSLRLSSATEAPDLIPGTLDNNVLSFVLPEITVASTARMFGDVVQSR